MNQSQHLHAGDGIAVDAVADLLKRLDDDEFADRFGPFALVVAEGDQTQTAGAPGTRDVDPASPGAVGAGRFRVFPVRKLPSTNQMRHITIGRTRNNDVWIDDATLSKFHAFLVVEAGTARIYDGGSANFTRLNGELVPVRGAGEPPALRSRDALRLGGLETTFVTHVELRAFVARLLEQADP